MPFSIKGRGKVIIVRDGAKAPHPRPRRPHRFVRIIVTTKRLKCKENVRFTRYMSKLHTIIRVVYKMRVVLCRV